MLPINIAWGIHHDDAGGVVRNTTTSMDEKWEEKIPGFFFENAFDDAHCTS